jgi:hypothetical protein
MRLLALLVAGLAIAGCGAAHDAASPPASSDPVPAVTVPTTETDVDPMRPPAIVLTSENGQQEAVPGSLCIFSLDPDSGEGEGSCGDSRPSYPSEVTGVAAGDEVAFVFRGAKVVHASGCEGADEQVCIGSVSVQPLGCGNREVQSVPLVTGHETRWTVGLERGAYGLHVFAYFESTAGATGDMTGSLGLTVAGAKKRDALGVRAVEPSMQVCEF